MVSEITGLKTSDRYFTPQVVLDNVAEQWGVIDLDPCHDPDPACLVRAELVYDIREGCNGLVLPWRGKVFCNMPYSDPAPWALRAVQHALASPENEALLLVNATPGSAWWARWVWPHARVCFLKGRLKFGRPSGVKPTWSPTDSCLVYYGCDHAGFNRVWGQIGTVVRPEVAAAA